MQLGYSNTSRGSSLFTRCSSSCQSPSPREESDGFYLLVQRWYTSTGVTCLIYAVCLIAGGSLSSPQKHCTNLRTWCAGACIYHILSKPESSINTTRTSVVVLACAICCILIYEYGSADDLSRRGISSNRYISLAVQRWFDSFSSRFVVSLAESLILWHVNVLPANGSINTSRYAHATIGRMSIARC
jgi:hypothetical protein